jgi:hypothetical protein
MIPPFRQEKECFPDVLLLLLSLAGEFPGARLSSYNVKKSGLSEAASFARLV